MTSVSFQLSPRPPFRLDLTVWVLRRRPQNRVKWTRLSYPPEEGRGNQG